VATEMPQDAGQQPFTYTCGGGVIKGWDMGARGAMGRIADVAKNSFFLPKKDRWNHNR